MTRYGVAGNGSQGRWYVEVEEMIPSPPDTNSEYSLIISCGWAAEELHSPPTYDVIEDIDNLIKALQQARNDLGY